MPHGFDMAQETGEAALRLPGAIRRAQQAQALFSHCCRILDLSRKRAVDPTVELPDLAGEREALGLGDSALDEVVIDSALVDGVLRVPHAARLHRQLVESLEDVIAALALGGDRAPGVGAASFHERLEALLSAARPPEEDAVPPAYLEVALGAADGGMPRLMADLREALEVLQRALVREEVAGAATFGLETEDRGLVSAFMDGLHRTEPLAFEEAPLAVIATRAGGALLLQVDIGRGEPHALVLRAVGLSCQVTLADPHLQRVRFLQGMLSAFPLQWADTRSRELRGRDGRETFYLATGRRVAADRAELARFLEFLGARLAFLLDWNRARKRLRSLVDGPASLELLRWAADQEVGHRGFLALGGERLVYDAIESASPTPVRYGQRLDEILGREPAVEFLRFVLRATSAGLLRRRSERFIRDEIRADLLGRFETLEHGVLAVAAEHALLVGSLAGAVRGALGAETGREEATARAAADWERKADGLVERIRTLARRSQRARLYARLIGEADDAADDLEEAAFLLSLPAARGPGAARDALAPLAALLVEGAGAWRDCLQASAHVTRGGAREDLQGFLEAVEHLVLLEHQTDDAERRVTAVLFGEGVDPRQLLLYEKVARALEQAADALARGALLLRDHFLAEMSGT